jgi:exosortase A
MNDIPNNRIKHHQIFILALFAWASVYFDVITNMVSVWNGSETYTYCFLIIPIVLFLINEKKPALANLPFQNNSLFLIPLLIGQIGYLLSDLAGVGVLTHLAAYGSLICLVGLIYGYELIKCLIFPLSFLIFCVPMGEEFVPVLQNVTADISVFLVEIVGIPIYREGLYLYIPNGTFEVAEACSGIRFLISMIAIGVLYAYLFYQSIWRRLIFVLLSIIIPILANGIRAFGSIYIGHISDMTQAVGADHLVYGWIFFSIVLMLLMAVGRIWQEPAAAKQTVINVDHTVLNETNKLNMFILVVAFLFIALKPSYAYFVVGSKDTSLNSSPIIKYLINQGAREGSPSWGSSFIQADKTYTLSIIEKNVAIEFYVADYYEDNPQKELINWGNKLFDIDKFSIVVESKLTLSNNIKATVLEIVSVRGEKKQLVYWYQIDNLRTSNKVQIKKAQLLSKLKGGNGGGEIVMVSFGNQMLTEKNIIQLLSNAPWIENES